MLSVRLSRHIALPQCRSRERHRQYLYQSDGYPDGSRQPQSGVTEGDYYVTNDTWNADGYIGLSQALHVCNYNSWYAIVSMNNATGDFAVKTSPNVQETWYPTPIKLSSLKSITSQLSDVPPGTGSNYGIWEFEYDIWLNGLADSKSTEVMIWT